MKHSFALILLLLLTACASKEEERMARGCMDRCVGERQMCVQNRGPACAERFERCREQCGDRF